MIMFKHDDWTSPTACCSFCEEPIEPPFLFWQSTRDIYICQLCCAADQRGLSADLRRLSDIHRALNPLLDRAPPQTVQ